MKNVFLTGGSGFLGKYIIKELIENGYNVFALSRSNSSNKILSEIGAQPIMTSLDDEQGLTDTIINNKCNIVIHCAAKLETNSKSIKELFKDNVDATQLLYQICKKLSTTTNNIVSTFCFISTEGVLMNGNHIENADENTPYPDFSELGWYNKSKAISEKQIIDDDKDEGSNKLKSIIIRLPLVWGSNDNVLDYLVGLCNKFQWFWIGGGKNYLSIVHAKNASYGIRLAIEKGDNKDIFHLTDGEPVEYRKFFTDRFLKKKVSTNKLYMVLPIPIAWCLVWIMSLVWKLFKLSGLPLLTKTGLIYSSKNFTIQDKKARLKLGYNNKINYNQGMNEL